MGGQAAINLIPKFKITDHDPRYIRATPDQTTVTELLNIKSALILAKLIKNTESKFNLGSSRLFAVSAGLMNAEVFVNEIETVAIINNAVRFKPSFGDIDLDVEFEKDVTVQQVACWLNNITGKYAASCSGNEVSVAVRLTTDPSHVIQIDIINVAGKEAYYEFNQFSSMADALRGIRGTVRDILIRAVASSIEIPKHDEEKIRSIVIASDVYKAFSTKYKAKKIEFKIRRSLMAKGLAYHITWIVDDKEKTFSMNKIQYDYVHQLSSARYTWVLGYNEIPIVHEMGFYNFDQMKHVTEMVKSITYFSKERRLNIWERFNEILKTKTPTATRALGQISHEEAETALNFLKPYIFHD